VRRRRVARRLLKCRYGSRRVQWLSPHGMGHGSGTWVTGVALVQTQTSQAGHSSKPKHLRRGTRPNPNISEGALVKTQTSQNGHSSKPKHLRRPNPKHLRRGTRPNPNISDWAFVQTQTSQNGHSSKPKHLRLQILDLRIQCDELTAALRSRQNKQVRVRVQHSVLNACYSDTHNQQHCYYGRKR
jgi:hypothetical protein